MSGPSDAFAQLYARAYRPLVGLLVTIGGDVDDAEEVAQEAFARLWDRWGKISRYDDPAAWVRMVAVRMLLSRIRRAHVVARLLRRFQAPADTAIEPSPTLVDFTHAVERLSPKQRAVVILHYVFDLPVDTVAAELGIPVGTVKSRLARAREALEPMLAVHNDTDSAAGDQSDARTARPRPRLGGSADA